MKRENKTPPGEGTRPTTARSPASPVASVPSPGASADASNHPTADTPPRRLRRLHRVWPDRNGIISYLLTPCVDGRIRVLDNEPTFGRFTAFLLDSPTRYGWFGRRFVIMPDHIHLIAHMGYDAIRLGQWIKALKAVVAGLEPSKSLVGPVPSPGKSFVGRVPLPGASVDVGRVPLPGASVPSPGASHPFTRIPRSWRWQPGFHDHKFRTPEAETRKWEYICLNPVRAKLVDRPEQWPYGGEIFYDEPSGPRLIRGTPPLLDIGILILEDNRPAKSQRPPGEGTRPAGDDDAPGKGTRPTTCPPAAKPL